MTAAALAPRRAAGRNVPSHISSYPCNVRPSLVHLLFMSAPRSARAGATPSDPAARNRRVWTRYHAHLVDERHRRKPTVRVQRRALLDVWTFIAPRDWRHATPHDLGRWLARPPRPHTRGRGTTLAPNTLASYSAAVRGFFGWGPPRRAPAA